MMHYHPYAEENLSEPDTGDHHKQEQDSYYVTSSNPPYMSTTLAQMSPQLPMTTPNTYGADGSYSSYTPRYSFSPQIISQQMTNQSSMSSVVSNSRLSASPDGQYFSDDFDFNEETLNTGVNPREIQYQESYHHDIGAEHCTVIRPGPNNENYPPADVYRQWNKSLGENGHIPYNVDYWTPQPQMPLQTPPEVPIQASTHIVPASAGAFADRTADSTPSSSPRGRPAEHSCTVPGCASRAVFKRAADLNRHKVTVHECRKDFQCDVPKCSRVGDNGFTRKDHLTEHRRSYHGLSIPKKSVRNNRRGKAKEDPQDTPDSLKGDEFDPFL